MNMSQTADAYLPAADSALTITFGTAGTINSLPNYGFDLSDGETASWTEQQTAWVDIVPRWPAKDMTLQLTAIPFLVPGHIATQQVFFYVNGLFCGLHGFFERQDCSIAIPRTALSGRSTRIALAIPSAVSPRQLGLSDDVRTLGIAITTLSLISV